MEQKKVTPEKVIEKLRDSFSQIDQQQDKILGQFRSLQKGKDNLLVLEKERLTQKYGSGHQQVTKISKRIAFNQEFTKALDIEIEKAKIEVPDADPASWMIHGRVLNEQYLGVRNLTVALYDEHGKWMRKISYACTSKEGYFCIIYPAKGTASEISAEQKLFLSILDKDHKIIHREADPLFVKPGTVDYKEIILSDLNGTCTPPEPGHEPLPGSGPGPETNPEPIAQPAKLPPDAWVVKGNVMDQENKGINGLTVSLYDKDLLFDDVLGTTPTDENGNFEIIYRTEAFKGLFDRKPDIYLKVLNKLGKVLYTSKKEVRPEAGREENLLIRIKFKK